MSLLQDILKWTEGLPLWQRHGARRLFEVKGGLSTADYAELYHLLKASRGLPCPEGIVAVPLAQVHLPASLTAGSKVVVKAVHGLANVNRIAPGQRLNFATSGMTIVYGANGSGKSGYSRVLKRACRARDQGEKVLPDASNAAARTSIPEASLDIEIDGTSRTVLWKASEAAPVELSAVAVFDSHCARSYLTAEQEIAYLPYGLDVVENLANQVLPELGRMLGAEIATVNVDRQPFSHLLGTTKVGALIAGLSDKTKPEELRNLAKLSNEDEEQVKSIAGALAEPDPVAKAKVVRLAADRMKNLAERILRCSAWVSPAAISKLQELHTTAATAIEAEKNAAMALRAGETLLPGTGDAIWKSLFEAAQKFSTSAAYPAHSFPHTENEAQCPLCQQQLLDGADRLQRFAKFIKDDVAKTAAAERQKLQVAKGKIATAAFELGFDPSLAAEVGQRRPEAVELVREFHVAVEARRQWMLQVLDSGGWNTIPEPLASPREAIRSLAAALMCEVRTLGKASNQDRRAALLKAQQELQARLALAKSLEAVIGLVERLKRVKALEGCWKDLETKGISYQSKQFASSAVTQTLRNALNTEFKALGIGHVQAVLRDKVQRGKTLYQLVLNLPVSARLEEILSEGEQRAIALGSFLAELKLANHAGAIVLDDPVSSLDHARRGRVARRLAAESVHRQVLVFTHDVVFLSQLRDASGKAGLEPAINFLESDGATYGHVTEGLPWLHKSFGERIDALEKRQRHFEKLPWPSDPPQALAGEMIRQYSFLRATIERVVQDLVLNGTVQRFRDYIEVSKLTLVVGTPQDEVDEIFRLYQRCHDVVEAHDPSSAKDEPPPTADEFGKDVTALKDLIAKITLRRKGTLSKKPT